MNAYTVGLLSGHVSIAGGEFYQTGDFPGWKSVKNVSWFDPKHDQPQLHAAVSLPTSSTIHHFFENCGMVPFYQYNVCFFLFYVSPLQFCLSPVSDYTDVLVTQQNKREYNASKFTPPKKLRTN